MKTVDLVINAINNSNMVSDKPLLAGGNKKLASYVGCWSMTPIVACYDCSTCASSCYGVQAVTQYKQSRECYSRNYDLSKRTDEFIQQMSNEIQLKGWRIVRLHSVGGDFYNEEYTNAWETIMLRNPNTMFYTYTKNPHSLRLNYLENCNIIYSFIETPIGLLRNYGSEEYCNLVSELFNVHICSLDESKGEKCMKDCTHCLTGSQCLIIEHGVGAKKDTYETDVDENGLTIIDKLKQCCNYR